MVIVAEHQIVAHHHRTDTGSAEQRRQIGVLTAAVAGSPLFRGDPGGVQSRCAVRGAGENVVRMR